MVTSHEIEDAWLRLAVLDEGIRLAYPAAHRGNAEALHRLKLMWANRNLAFEDLVRLLEASAARR